MQKTSVIICFLIIVLFPRIGVSQKGDTIYVPKKKVTATPTVCDECDKKEVPKKQKKAKVIKVKLKGRLSVVLDNSGSMERTGTDFRDIKRSLFDALMIVPSTHECGLRVFDDDASASRLISPYSRDLDPLRQTLSDVEPGGGTYIGQSLNDAAHDLLQKPEGDNRLLFITDGEGADSDIDAAREVKDLLSGLKGEFKCNFILFSGRRDVINETPIGQVVDILGCKLTIPGDYASATTLSPALLRIFGFDFYWIWIILSALAYLVLIILTSYLVFDIQYARGVLPRLARWTSIGFIFALIPITIGAHIIGLFSGLPGIGWGLVILAVIILVMAAIGSRRSRKKGGRYESSEGDPFA